MTNDIKMIKDLEIGDLLICVGKLLSWDQNTKDFVFDNINLKVSLSESKIEIVTLSEFSIDDSNSTTSEIGKSKGSSDLEEFSEESLPSIEGQIRIPYVSDYTRCYYRV